MIDKFWQLLKAECPTPRLLECGSRRYEELKNRSVRDELLQRHPGARYLGIDALDGPGVDRVCDLHDLSEFEAGSFDAVYMSYVLEHVRRPWIAAAQLARVCRVGGVLWCATNQTLGIHAYPADYFRFSSDALSEVFAPDGGWQTIDRGMDSPCRVVPLHNEFPHAHDWNFQCEAWINSWVICRRVPCALS